MQSEHVYKIVAEFTAGYVAAQIPQPRPLSESGHWIAGWDAGYEARKARNEKIDEYLVSIGRKPLAAVRLV